MSSSSIPRPVLIGLIGLVVVLAAFFLTRGKGDDTSTDVPPAPAPTATTETPKAETKSSASDSTQAAEAGGDQKMTKDERAVAKVQKAFFADVAAGRGNQACSKLAGNGAEVFEAFTLSAVGLSCGEAFNLVSNNLSASDRAALATLQISSVTVEGDRAIVADAHLSSKRGDLGNIYQGGDITYTKVDGAWKVSGFNEGAIRTEDGRFVSAERAENRQALPRSVERAIEKKKVVVLLFVSPRGPDNRDVTRSVRAVRRRDNPKVAVFIRSIGEIDRYVSIVGQGGITQTPTLVVVDRKGRADTQVGWLDQKTIDNTVYNAL